MPYTKLFLAQRINQINSYWTKRGRALVYLDKNFILELDKITKETLNKIIEFNSRNKKINKNYIVPRSYFLITSLIPEWLMAFPEHIGQIAELTEKIFSKKQNFISEGHKNAKNIAINDLESRIGPWMKACKILLSYGFTKQLNYILCNLMDSINLERIKAEALTSREYVSTINLCSYLKPDSEPANQLMGYLISKFKKLAPNMGNFDIITSLSAFSRFKIICKIGWEDLRNTLTPFLNNMSTLELGVLLDSIGQFRVQDSHFFEKFKNAIPIDDFDVTGMAILLKSLVRLDSPRIMDMKLVYGILKNLDISKASSRYLTTMALSLGIILSQTRNLELFIFFLSLLERIENVKLNYKDSTKILIAIMCVWSPVYYFPLKSLRSIMHIIISNSSNQKTIGFSKSENIEIQKNIKSLQEALNTTLSLRLAGPYALYVVPQWICTLVHSNIYYSKLSTEYYSLSTRQLNSLKREIDTRSCNNKEPNIRLYIVPDSVTEYTLAIKILKEAWTSINSTDLLNDSITTDLSTLNGSNVKSINCVQISIAYSSKNLVQDSKLPGLHGNYYIFLQKSNYFDNENDSKFLLEISDPGIHVMLYGLKSDENMIAGIIWNIAQKSFFGPHSKFSDDGSKISNAMSALPFHSQYDFNFILTTDNNFRPSWNFHSQVLPIIRPTLDAFSTISHINIQSQIIGSTGILSCSEKSQDYTIINVKNECLYSKLDKLLPRGVISKASHFAPPEINFIAYINDLNLVFQDGNKFDNAISIRNWGFISTLMVHEPNKFYKLSDLEVKHLSGQWFTHLRISFGLPLHLLEYASITKIDNPNIIYLKKLQNLTFLVKAFEFEAWDTFTNFEYNSLAAKALDEYINSTTSNLSYLVSISKLHFRMQVPQRIRMGFKECISLLRCSISTLNGETCGDLTDYRNLLLRLRFISKDVDHEPLINVSLGLARQAYEVSKNLLSDDSMGLINYTYSQSTLIFLMFGVFPFLSTQIATIIKLIKKKIKN